MGGIPDSLIRDFVKIAKEPVKSGGDSTLYGTVTNVTGSGANREAAVRIDGADIDTPASLGMDAEQGDRVSILMKNHEAIINGNITSPASARTATKYMRFTDEGLKIGSFGEASSPSGNYILITDNAYYIKTSDDVTLLSVTSDGTRVYGLDGKIKASFLSGSTTIYDSTGTKAMAEFLSSGVKIYNENGIITSKFDATGAVLLNPTSNDNDGVRIYNGSQATAANLLASFVASGVKLHALVTSGGTTVNRTLAEFLASGLRFYNQSGVLKTIIDDDGVKLYSDSTKYAATFTSTGTRLYNQNGKRTFLANADGVHLYGNDEIMTASFRRNGLTLFGNSDGVRIYDAPSSDDPNAPHTAQLLASFISDGVRLHALVTSNGTTVNRTVAEFLNTGLKFRNQSGVLQTSMDADGLKLYNKDGEVTASFEDKGCVLYGRNDGIRIYDSPTVANVHTRQLLASFKSDGVRLHTIVTSGGTTVSRTVAEFLSTGIGFKRPNGTKSIDIGDSDVTLYDSTGQNPVSVRSALDDLQNQHDMLRIEMVNNYALQSDLSDLEDTVDGKASQSSVNSITNDLNTLLTQLSTMVQTGTSRVTQTATAGALTIFRAEPSVPTGYVITGVRDIKITNSSGNASIHYSLNQFAASDSAVQAWVYNDTGSNASLNVDFEWVATRTSFSLS